MYNIVLAAGKNDFRNLSQGMVSSQLLAMVNGRPIIAWILSALYKKTDQPIIIAVSAEDAPMRTYLHKRCEDDNRITECLIPPGLTILHSVKNALDAIPPAARAEGLRLNLGDTLLLSASNAFHPDTIYVADILVSSENWCVAEIGKKEVITHYFNKKPNLPPTFKALVGRYEFSNADDLLTAINKAIGQGSRELSDAFEIYAQKHPLHALTIDQNEWIDFGHLEGMARARSLLIESRCFNTLSIHPILPEIVKTSENAKKLEQEAFWYTNLPGAFQSLAPRLLAHGQDAEFGSIKLEYYGYGTLTEKFVYLDLSNSFWKTVLTRLFQVISLLAKHKVPKQTETNLKAVYLDKTKSRLVSLRDQSPVWAALLSRPTIEINGKTRQGLPSLRPFIEEACEALAANGKIAIIHGDLCFNNILYDANAGIVKLIDPRGEFGTGKDTIYGDPRYDAAKIRHSFCGLYDHIIEGTFVLDSDPDAARFRLSTLDGDEERERMFDEIAAQFNFNPAELRFIEALLFLSMIPLHRDSQKKQMAFFVTAIEKLNRCRENAR